MSSKWLVSCTKVEEPGLGVMGKELLIVDAGPYTGYMASSLEGLECVLYFVFG